MRPRPSEIIAGVRSTLAEVIAPELNSDHARSRLSDIRAVLAQIDWDDVAFNLKARTLELARRLDAAREWVTGDIPEPPTNENFIAYEDFSNRVGLIAADTIERLAAHLEQNPDDDTARRLYGRLLESF